MVYSVVRENKGLICPSCSPEIVKISEIMDTREFKNKFPDAPKHFQLESELTLKFERSVEKYLGRIFYSMNHKVLKEIVTKIKRLSVGFVENSKEYCRYLGISSGFDDSKGDASVYTGTL